MKYIHERAGWPDFVWDNDELAAALGRVRHQQGRLLGRVEAIGFEVRDQANLSTITRDVVKSSAIEGEKLDPQEVRSAIARRLGLEVAGLPRAGRDVEDVVEMMLDATQRFEEPLTADRLFGWHAALFPMGRSGSVRITVGGWRTKDAGPMQAVSGPLGRERVHFEAPHADRLEDEMRRFLAWINAPLQLDPVLKAAVAHFWFVTVHPFEDGNGRIARAIADLCLARADGSSQRFYSMSSQIEAERADYYSTLELTQRGDLDITSWMRWFLDCLERALGASEQALANVFQRARIWSHASTFSLHDRQRKVIRRMLNDFVGNLTTSKYAKLAGCSTDTALRDIQALVECGILVRNPGGGRSVSYRLVEP